MKSLTLALVLLAGTAGAYTVCSRCEYLNGPASTYLGGYWPADKGTFQNRNIAADIGQFKQFDNYWPFDVMNNEVARLSVTTRPATALDGFYAIEVYADTGYLCDVLRCPLSLLGPPLISVEMSGTGKRVASTESLVPGRYVIRFSGGTRLTGESAYSMVLLTR